MAYPLAKLLVAAFSFSLVVAAFAQSSSPTEPFSAAEVKQPDVSKLPKDLLIPCPTPTFTPVNETPDKIEQLFTNIQKYRLVIGAGEFKDQPKVNNRAFVAPTAALIDARLGEAGYSPLPNLAVSGTPYLEGARATKGAIKDALSEMAGKLKEGDLGIIYYVGHGSIAPSHRDLSLSVYDRPVDDDEGIRVSDIIGSLEVSQYRTDVKEIPHYIIVLETCYSGIAVPDQEWVISTAGGLQTVSQVKNQASTLPQIVIISATTIGLDTVAYDLHGTNLSAFGFFFLRALNEDWECADTNQDGILTLNELTNYIADRLQLAATLTPPAIDGLMKPEESTREPLNFLAYSAAHHVIDGDRGQIAQVWVQPPANEVTTLNLPSGSTFTCTNSTPCSTLVSLAQAGDIQVSSQAISEQSNGSGISRSPRLIWGTLDKVFPKLGAAARAQDQSVSTSSHVLKASIPISSLSTKFQQEVAGAMLRVN